MDDFFDAVDFLFQEENEFEKEGDFYSAEAFISQAAAALDQNWISKDVFNTEKDEKTERFYTNESFLVSEKTFEEPFFPSVGSENPSEVISVSYNIEDSVQNTQRDVFNSVEEVSYVENVRNSDKSTLINIDARSYNSISKNVDIDNLSDYIADRLYEVISASSEVVHGV